MIGSQVPIMVDDDTFTASVLSPVCRRQRWWLLFCQWREARGMREDKSARSSATARAASAALAAVVKRKN